MNGCVDRDIVNLVMSRILDVNMQYGYGSSMDALQSVVNQLTVILNQKKTPMVNGQDIKCKCKTQVESLQRQVKKLFVMVREMQNVGDDEVCCFDSSRRQG